MTGGELGRMGGGRLPGMQDPGRESGVESAAVEGAEDPVVRPGIGSASRCRQRRVFLHEPPVRERIQEGDFCVGSTSRHQRSRAPELVTDLAELVVGSARVTRVGKDRAPGATSAHATWRHWPSKAGRLSQGGPMCMALVSVTRKPSWREEYIRSAEKYSAQVPVVAHFSCEP